MRKRIYEVIEAATTDDALSKAYDTFMMALIVVSLVPLAFKTEYTVLKIVDKVCASIFVIDYVLRLITADYKYGKKSVTSFLRYPFSFMALIDLLSILPAFVPINGGLKALRAMRLFRILRTFRVFKVVRYSKSLQIMEKVLKTSAAPLAAVGSLAVTYILISALVILNIEPETFNSYFDAVYWATISLTTMGYGDIYPVTNIGRFFTMLSSLMGIAIVALPSGIITAGYMREIERDSKSDD